MHLRFSEAAPLALPELITAEKSSNLVIGTIKRGEQNSSLHALSESMS